MPPFKKGQFYLFRLLAEGAAAQCPAWHSIMTGQGPPSLAEITKIFNTATAGALRQRFMDGAFIFGMDGAGKFIPTDIGYGGVAIAPYSRNRDGISYSLNDAFDAYALTYVVQPWRRLRSEYIVGNNEFEFGDVAAAQTAFDNDFRDWRTTEHERRAEYLTSATENDIFAMPCVARQLAAEPAAILARRCQEFRIANAALGFALMTAFKDDADVLASLAGLGGDGGAA